VRSDGTVKNCLTTTSTRRMSVPEGVPESTGEEDKRYTVMTDRAQQQYDERKPELDNRLDNAWSKTRSSIGTLYTTDGSADQIEAAQLTLRKDCEVFNKCADDIFALLIRANTTASLSEYHVLRDLVRARLGEVNEAGDAASKKLSILQEARSTHSRSRSSRSARSSQSSVVSAAVKARAEAAAVAAEASSRHKIAEVESVKAFMYEKDQLAAAEIVRVKAEMEAAEKIRLAASIRKTAELDAQIEVIRHEERMLAANARAEALEQAAIEQDDRSETSQKLDSFEMPPTDQLPTDHLVSNYIQGNFQQQFSSNYTETHGNQHNMQSSHLSPHASVVSGIAIQSHAVVPNYDTCIRDEFVTNTPQVTAPSPGANPNINTRNGFDTYTRQPTVPSAGTDLNNTNTSESDKSVRGWFEYFAHKDLVCQGLALFDDNPVNYRAWKLSFEGSVRDARITPAEELNLLVKWTGPKSTEIIKKIRSVNIHDPAVGLKEAWARLGEYYGRPEVITNSLLKTIKDFPKINQHDKQKLREFSDLLYMLKASKDDLPGLSYLDTYLGVNELVQKLPYGLPEKWRSRGKDYKEKNNVSFPPFEFFVSFVRKMADERNDPSFDFSTFEGSYSNTVRKPFDKQSTKPRVVARKTAVDNSHQTSDPKNCPIHLRPHSLEQCRGFKAKTHDEKLKILQELGLCFRCCVSKEHRSRECTVKVKCSECGSERHPSVLHMDSGKRAEQSQRTETEYGGERTTPKSVSTDVSSNCTEVCGDSLSSKSCAKICLVKVYPPGKPELAKHVYVILDDQSNRSLAKTELFDLLGIEGHTSAYTLRTCSGQTNTTGRRARDLVVESLDGKVIPLPTIIECNEIPDSRSEIPTAAAARHFAHLHPIADYIPSVDNSAQILMLLGRDILQVHKVREQRNGRGNAPFAQRLDLGWVIVGDVCLDGAHRPDRVGSYKTYVHDNGRTSHLQPCPNRLVIKEVGHEFEKPKEQPISSLSVQCNKGSVTDHAFDKGQSEMDSGVTVQERQEAFFGDRFEDGLGQTVFKQTRYDNKPGLSVEDRKFVRLMTREMHKDQSNSWTAPLPFKDPKPILPNNREVASRRLVTLLRSLSQNQTKKTHYFAFMGDLLRKGHAELAPALDDGEECWYLAHFGVYHPRKLDKIRVVFDSSCQTKGISLNGVLLSGPDLMNSLLGVLMRFRHEPVAFIADIRQMFHSFFVREDHRNFLKFLWYKENDPDSEIVEYRMKVHLFGNSPSPAVATFGLRKTATEGEEKFGKDARQFVERNFYVDDGLKSTATPSEAIDLLKRTQQMLADANLKLHKIASNSREVMDAFPTEDRAGDLQNLDLSCDALPMQRSLGVCWNIATDTFAFNVSAAKKPYTRRGVLSVTNSVYDPLGLVAPVTLEGKHLLRSMMAEKGSNVEWDQPLPPDKQKQWQRWTESLSSLSELRIHRAYAQCELDSVVRKELHVFSDASDIAIAACAYLRLADREGKCHVSFVIGKSKLAPTHATTTPRLELCAAVLAVELSELIEEEIDLVMDAVSFYSDSRVILGYIKNETRRFYVYVSNRVQRIRHSTESTRWFYVPTDKNPADHATRAVAATDLANTAWLTGPEFLRRNQQLPTECVSEGPVEGDPEVRPQISALRTEVTNNGFLTTERYDRFSKWQTLVRAVGNLTHIVRNYGSQPTGNADTCYGWHRCKTSPSVDELTQAQNTIIQSVQRNSFQQEIDCLKHGLKLPTDSSIRSLNPFIDTNGLLRVGGRLDRSDLPTAERNPLIIPGKCHLATLLIRHQHEKVQHQGRHLTHGAVRAAGLWILGGKRLINKIISDCVKCRKLRGRQEIQQMADLPSERLSAEPPFTYVGLDVFGPWSVIAQRTRGGHAKSKRWAILFTCMAVRAVHIEVIDQMDASTTINALRRFFAIRGPARKLRSDNGTNFVGACNELSQLMSGEDFERVREFLIGEGCSWEFNPPHSSHMGGVWERMIGVVRRVLDSMFLDLGPTQLTHDVLTTLMAEVSAIVNARPLVPVSSDPEAPEILTPASLLTQKFGVPDSPPPGLFSKKDLYGRQWRRVQYLANVFWSRWRREYLPTLQQRRKWQDVKENISPGDLVLLKDKQLSRNEWPLGRVVAVMPSDDSKVRKVSVNIARNNTVQTFYRPVSELVLLMRE
jgi:hypothetical protein